MADITPPTIVITANKTALKAGDTALITFTLSEISTDFVFSDITVTGGVLSNFSGSGINYSAIFTPSKNSSAQESIVVGNFKFSDAAGNANEDGAEVNNRVTFTIDTIAPTINITSDRTYLGLDERPTIIFTLSEPSSNFDISDIYVSGGTLSSFSGSGNLYSAVITPSGGEPTVVVNVNSSFFTDSVGNSNTRSNYLRLFPFDPTNTNVVWVNSFGSNSDETAYALTTGTDGAIYVAGSTQGNLDGLANSGLSDGFLTKYNPDGTKVWTKLLGSTANDFTRALTTGIDGAIYVAGSTQGNLDGLTKSGFDDGFLTKYNPDGTKVWTQLIGSITGNSGFALGDRAYALTTGTDGTIYVAGSTEGNLDGLTNSGSSDGFLTKFNSDGTKVWTKLLGSLNIDEAFALTTGTDGAIYVAGSTQGNLDGLTNSGLSDGFLTKYNPDGTKVWTKLIGSIAGDRAYALTTGTDGNIYVAGSTEGDLDGLTNSRRSDCFLTKYSPDGTKVWTKLLGSINIDEAYALTTGTDGAIYVAGYTYANLDGPVVERWSADGFLTKYNADGTKVWTKLLGSDVADKAFALTTGNDGAVYVSGFSGGYEGSGMTDATIFKLTGPDLSKPQIAIISTKTSLNVGDSAEITFTLSKPSSNFIYSDISVLGGLLSNFQGSSISYKATFTADIKGATGASVSVGNGKFSDAIGIFNEDGADANNKVTFTVKIPPDTTPPTIAVTSNSNSLSSLQTALLTFTLSEVSTNFSTSDVNVLGGTLSNFSGSGTTYTAVFTPLANSIVNGAVSVASAAFTDTAGNPNADGSDTNNTIILAVDTFLPTIALSSTKSSLIAGDTTTLTFTLSEASTTFTASDVTVTGGALANFTGSGTSYSALFTPIANSTTNGTLSVASGVFTDTAGNANADGSDANNLLILTVDTLLPTIAVSSNKLSLQGGDTATLTFTLSEASTSFVSADVVVSGGTLSNFAGSGTSYTATFTLGSNSTLNGTISVANGVFTDAVGNKNADGSDANNAVSFARIPTITNETHTLSVIVDKSVLGADAVLLKGLKESMTFTNGVMTKHIVEYSGLTFDYSQIDSLITTVTRDDEFTAEFTKEINDYLGVEQNITYSAAVAIVGSASIDGIILSVAGADGNFVA